MPSYQDIESRLQIVEEKTDFIMRSMIHQVMERLPTLDVNGNPITKVTRKSLLELYREFKDVSLAEAASKAAWNRSVAGEGGDHELRAGGADSVHPDPVGPASRPNAITLTDA